MPFRCAKLLAGALLCVLTTGHPAGAQTERTSGLYKDSKGHAHVWSVNPTNALIWEGAPYMPVGGCFTPQSLRSGATPEDWKQDEHVLDVLHAHGAQDVLIRPVESAVDIPAAAWQRLIDRLEAGGLRYGIAFGLGVQNPLFGTVVRPSSYRTARIEPGSDVSWKVPDATGAYYVLVNETDGADVRRKGHADVMDGMVTVRADDRLGDGAIGLLYPRKAVPRSRTSGLPDLWDGYDAYRDRLVGLFSGVHFGPGLRFFLDPLAGQLTIESEAENVVPESVGFRVEWEAFLARRYATIDDLASAWTITGQRIADFRAAAALVPLWFGSKGVPFFLDPASAKLVPLGGGTPRYWVDLRKFETDTISYYMNSMADVLKREIADVPVIYTHTMSHSVFTNTTTTGGFDGLGVAAYGQGTALITAGADAAVSQTMESSRPMWLVVTETADSAPDTHKKAPGYPSQQSIAYDYQWLRGIGAKGIFAYAYRAAPNDQRAFDLVSVPEQLDWLRDIGERTYRSSTASTGQARLLPYPNSAAGLVHPGPIPNTGVWWAPSMAEGSPIEFGSSYAGYSITLPAPEGQITVLWSLRGARETRLYATNPAKVTITTPDGRPIVTRPFPRKKMLSFLIPDGPVVLHTNGEPVYPLEAVDDALRQFHSLVRQAVEARLPSAQPLTYTLDRADQLMRRGDTGGAYVATQHGLAGAISVTLPYTWCEAESADSHTFSEVAQNAGASNGAMLTLSATTAPPADGYTASIPFRVPADSVYTVWLSCTPPGPRASPFVWSVDGGDLHPSTEAGIVGDHFLGEQLVWYKLGGVSLHRGDHSFRIRVSQPVPGGERYMLTLDSLLVTRGEFHPSGISKPSLDVLPPLAAAPPVPGAEDATPPPAKSRRRK